MQPSSPRLDVVEVSRSPRDYITEYAILTQGRVVTRFLFMDIPR